VTYATTRSWSRFATERRPRSKAPGDHCGDFVRWYKRAPHSAIGFVTERRAVYEAERSGRISACDLASAIQAVMNCNCGLRRRAMVRCGACSSGGPTTSSAPSSLTPTYAAGDCASQSEEEKPQRSALWLR